MATEFVMPKLGLTMEEGTILHWLVDDGATVVPGAPVMVIETDKVESDVEANSTGRLHRIGAEGQTFLCGEVIGLLLAEGESVPTPATQADQIATVDRVDAAEPKTPVTPAAADMPAPLEINGTRRFVSPNARRLAAERGIDLGAIRGTGPMGRVVSEDLDEARHAQPDDPRPSAREPREQSARSLVPASAAARDLADLLGIDLATVPPDPVEACVTIDAVARHVRARLQRIPSAAFAPVPHRSDAPAAAITMDADMDAVDEDRFRRSTTGKAPAYTDYIIAAVGRALRAHPGLNAQVTPAGIELLPDIDVGLAVVLDDGLMVPVVRHADRLPLAEVAAETRRLAKAARQVSLTLRDLEGGTFSVSALGMFGVDAFTPVINPPNVAILGIGRIRDDLILDRGVVSVVRRTTLSLVWDHRVLDVAPAANFCKTIVQLLNDPAQLD
jgi:pyruvate dehydrogenase E2 component (dihydrolipoamide acetyltransferase)